MKIKGASITDEQAAKEFDVHPDFISNAIRAGQLEVKFGTTPKGRQWRKILRVQLQQLINADPVGRLHLARMRSLKDLQAINREINLHRKRLDELNVRKIEIELWRNQNQMPS